MSKKYLILSQNIINELLEIRKTVQRVERAWSLALTTDESLYLDSVALNLHNFYNGIERIFERIAENVDELKPDSVNWHQEILRQMTLEVPNIRPAVISPELRESLDEYRAFRHIVRNVYSYNFKVDKMKYLVENINKVFDKIEDNIKAFCKFLEGTK